jgi:hypothetical protein
MQLFTVSWLAELLEARFVTHTEWKKLHICDSTEQCI